MNQNPILKYTKSQKKLLRFFYDNPASTRAEAVTATGFSLVSVSNFVTAFIEDGIILEEISTEVTVGRPAAPLSVNPDFAYVIAVDIGAVTAKIGIVNLSGRIIHKKIIPAADQNMPSHTATPSEVKDYISSMLRLFSRDKFWGICIGISGLIDFKNKRTLVVPNIVGWNDIDVVEEFSKPFGLPVYLDTSARCMALAEQRFGAGKNIKEQIFVSIGSGIAAGIISDGKLFRGASGLSGELGHNPVEGETLRCTCGNRGCLENCVTLPRIITILKSLYNTIPSYYSPIVKLAKKPENITVEHLLEGIKAGDKLFDGVIEDVIKKLGMSLAAVANLFNPSLIVLGGGTIEALPFLINDVDRIIKSYTLYPVYNDLQIRKSALGSDGAIIGSALQLINDYFYHS